MTISTKPLSAHFGVDVTGIDLNTVTAEHLFPQLRALFEEHSALLFRGQDMTDETHLRIAGLFGPIEDRQADERKPDEAFEILQVHAATDRTFDHREVWYLSLRDDPRWPELLEPMGLAQDQLNEIRFDVSLQD